MNREAVALGTPVWTTFEGRLGAVDEALIAEGRLRRLERAGGRRARQRATARAARERVRRDPARARRPAAARRWRAVRPRGRRRTAADAPPDPFRGRARPSPRAAAGRAGRGAGRAGLLPGLPAALRRRAPCRPYERPVRAHAAARDRAGSSSCFARSASTGSWMALLVPARIRCASPRPSSSATLALVGLHRGRPARSCGARASRRTSRSRARPACSRCSSCSCCVFLGGARFVARTRLRAPAARLPRRAATRARVLIVGAGDGGRLVLREILRNPDLGSGPSASSTTTRASARAHRRRARCSARPTSSTRILEDVEPDEVLIAIPSAPGTCAPRSCRACRERGVPVRTLPTVFELLQTAAAGWSARSARCAWRTSSAASPCGWRSSASART